MDFEKKVTVSAPINIALVKYWGKENEENIIPKHNSISLTLDKNHLKSTTYLEVSTALEHNSLILNNKECEVTKRMLAMFDYAIQKSNLSSDVKGKLKFNIKSFNNFPTAAGLASSASGMAALAFAIGKVFSLLKDDISVLARLGSGSATRSVYGGIVEWIKGDSNTSRAVQLYSHDYWPELRVLICVLSGAEKKVPSTRGMQDSLATSQLIQYRIEKCVEQNLAEMRQALADRDFQRLAAVTMRESNQLHAVCLDSVPPIVYLNAASYSIIEFVHAINDIFGSNRLAYTFDAGPNAFLIMEQTHQALVQRFLDYSFGTKLFDEAHLDDEFIGFDFDQSMLTKLPQHIGAIKSVIKTQVGPGPEICLL